MNHLSHARDLLDRPWVLAGTALPDWLASYDLRARLRPRHLEETRIAGGTTWVDLRLGVDRHFLDDAWFHAADVFREVWGELSGRIRKAYPGTGIRGSFYSHLLLEMLLDAHLAEEEPGASDAYLEALAVLDPTTVAAFAEAVLGRSLPGFMALIEKHRGVRIFDAYSNDDAVTARLDAAGRRARQPALPGGFAAIVSAARPLVRSRAAELLTSPAEILPAPGETSSA